MCRKRLISWVLCAFVAGLVVGPAAQAGDPTLIAWWKLDDGAGTVVLDSSDYGNNGTVMNPNAGLGTGGSVWFNDPERGMVISFNGADGSGAYVDTDVIIPALTLNNSFTWAFWAKQPAAQATNNDTILGNRYGGTSSPLQFTKFTPTRFECYNDDGAYVNGINYNSIPADVWVHHALVIDGASQTYYRDGVPILTNTMTKTMDENPFYMGADGFSGAAENWQGYLSDVRLYERALSAKEVLDVMAGKGPVSDIATDPIPEHEAIDIPRDAVLTWTAGQYAQTHDIYLGTDADAVANASRAEPMDVLVSQGQSDAAYDPEGLLTLGQTYYWRIDEVNAPPDSTIYKGEVWSFTAEPFAYPIANVIATSNGSSDAGMGPENTVNGSGLNASDQHSVESVDMWLANAPANETLYVQYEFDRVYKLHEMLVWNYNSQFELILGFGLKDVTVEYSENGTDWTSLGDVQFAQGTAKTTYTANTTVEFNGVPAKYVRLNVNSGWGMMGQYGLSEVRFLYIPAQAREPEPADGATDINPASALSWRAGREAVSHEVYLGTDPEALALAETVSQATYAPTLEFGKTYYWQIVEVNEADEISAWAGDIWSFSTQEYALIDGMEDYNDDVDAATTIFDAWIDGWVTGNGSTVGYFDAPFAERTIVHSGTQSMPLQYDNTTSPFYSEAERTFDSPLDWTNNGADTLVLYVRGVAPAFAEAADGSIVMNAIGADIWDVSDQFRYAYKSLNGNGSMVVRVDSIVRSNEWAKAGVMIRETLEPGSAHAFIAATPEPSHGVSFQRRPVADQASANTDVADVELPQWVKLTRTGNIFTAQYSADGVTWMDVTPAAPVSIPMAANVYIGLALTSHDVAISTAAEFSNVSTTGNVTGNWQVEEVGIAQPVGNSSQPMYVTIEDSAGKTKTVASADTAITARQTWQEWAIPYSELSGVNLSRVEKMTVGVGSKSNPTADGTGIVYVDDIGYGSPAIP